MNPVEVNVTCASEDEASAIMKAIVEQRLAACGQSWPIRSCYWWNSEVVVDAEHLVLFKTTERHFDAICELVKQLHSYELPAIVMIPLQSGGPGYVEWLRENTATAPGS